MPGPPREAARPSCLRSGEMSSHLLLSQGFSGKNQTLWEGDREKFSETDVQVLPVWDQSPQPEPCLVERMGRKCHLFERQI